jgi:urease accessory protein
MQPAAIIDLPKQQRARGKIAVSAICDESGLSRLKSLRQEGSFKSVFPRTTRGKVEAVIVNTAGGITGGDEFSSSIAVHEGASVSVTTQAAERIYRASASEAGVVTTALSVEENGHLFWIPQETILFEGARLKRTLNAEVHATAKFLMLEPLVFGREASGETIRNASVQDSVSISSNGIPLYLDKVKLKGDLSEIIERSGVASAARAMASLVFVDRHAADKLIAVRQCLPLSGGASLLAENVMVIRLLSVDSFVLRRTLLPILDILTDHMVPKNWRL